MVDSVEERRRATMIARRVAYVVMAIVAVLFLQGHLLALTSGAAPRPVTTTTVVTEPGETRSAETTDQDGTDAVDSTTFSSSSTSTSTQTTTVEEPRGEERNDWFGIELGNPAGGLVVEVFVVLIAGFIAGGIAQRLLLGHYAFKLGPIEMVDLPAVSADDAKAAAQVPEIRIEDVSGRRAAAAMLEYSAWWMTPPPPEPDLRPSLIVQRVQLEAGVRQLAHQWRIDARNSLTLVVTELVEAAPESTNLHDLGRSILRLVALGDRLIAGAKIASEADFLLRQAFIRAQRQVVKLMTVAD